MYSICQTSVVKNRSRSRGGAFMGRSDMNSSGTSMARIISKKSRQTLGPVRQHQVARNIVSSDKNFNAIEAKLGRQTHGLAGAILEQFCYPRLGHRLNPPWSIHQYITILIPRQAPPSEPKPPCILCVFMLISIGNRGICLWLP